MTRLHADPIEVRTRTAPHGPVPEQFLWRGRLYLVREVLARWTASGAWWQPQPQSRYDEPGAEIDAAVDAAVDDNEQQWWRVEASDGRAVEVDSGRVAALSGGPGVYDLCFSWGSSTWSLKRVLD